MRLINIFTIPIYLKDYWIGYPNVKLCLDIGRMHLQDRIDDGFSGYEFVERFAKHAELVHLWNVQV